METRVPPRPFFVYACVTGGIAAACLLVSARNAPIVITPVLPFLLLVTVIAENLAVDMPSGGSASISYPMSLATIILMGPTAGAVVAAFSGFNLNDLRRRRSWSLVLFNVAQLVVSAVLSGWAYRGLIEALSVRFGSVAVPIHQGVSALAVIPLALALAALAAVSVAINAALVGVALTMIHGTPLKEIWAASIGWVLPTQFALSPLGLAIAQILGTVGPVGFLLFVVPLIVARQVYVRYVALREAYVDTTRSLVAAIEAKDPYTRGHSERVAALSRRIAQAIHLDEKVVSRLEWAGLLHDLGKVGISNRTLQKPASLTRDEFDEIKRHPGIGAHILESVAFLHDVVPVVAAHHERLDGSGYSLGLAGDDIPLEARILAVADCFDAMTSRRPYREALSPEVALGELQCNAGKHFDERVVAAFAGLEVATPGAEALGSPAVEEA